VSETSVVLHTGGLSFATEKSVVERVLSRWPGVLAVSANPVSQTSNVTFDPERTTVAELRRCVQQCGYECAGQSVPEHISDPLEEPI
jgi:Cu2+-exporting ATPase